MRLPNQLTSNIAPPYGGPCSTPVQLRAPHIRGGAEVLLKIGIPSAVLPTEVEALRWFDCGGSARLVADDAEMGAILNRAPHSLRSLSRLGDHRQATSIAALQDNLAAISLREG